MKESCEEISEHMSKSRLADDEMSVAFFFFLGMFRLSVELKHKARNMISTKYP